MVVGELATETDVLVVGGGPGGYVAALRAAQLGREVTLVEQDRLGGVCLQVGCIPTKALVDAARSYHRLRTQEAQRGIIAQGVHLDFSRLLQWTRSVTGRLTTGVEGLLRAAGVTVVRGRATFTGLHQVSVATAGGRETYRFRHAIVATGSRPAVLPGFEPDGQRVLDSAHLWGLEELPARLVVIGGGNIGLELGTALAQLGVQVTILERDRQLLPGTDPELVQVVARRLRRLGVQVHTGVLPLEWEPAAAGVTVRFQDAGGGRQQVEADRILVCVGRVPNTDGLGLEAIGVPTDQQGRVVVDKRMRTRQAHIYAIGDIVPGPMLAHKASMEGRVAAEVIAGRPAAADFTAMPKPVFSDPELAVVGLSEDEARRQGYDPVVGRFPLVANGRALTLGERDGFVKVVADRASGVVLGAGIVGPEASHLIAEVALAVEMGATLEDLALTVHPHPTLSEAIMEAAEAALGHPVHITAGSSPRR